MGPISYLFPSGRERFDRIERPAVRSDYVFELGVIFAFYWPNKTSILHGLPLPSPRTQTARSHFLVLRFPFWLTWAILHDLQPAFLRPPPPGLHSGKCSPCPYPYLLFITFKAVKDVQVSSQQGSVQHFVCVPLFPSTPHLCAPFVTQIQPIPDRDCQVCKALLHAQVCVVSCVF